MKRCRRGIINQQFTSIVAIRVRKFLHTSHKARRQSLEQPILVSMQKKWKTNRLQSPITLFY